MLFCNFQHHASGNLISRHAVWHESRGSFKRERWDGVNPVNAAWHLTGACGVHIYIYIFFFKYTYLFMTREEVHDVSWGVGWLIWQSTVVGYPQPFIQQCLQMHWDRKWFGVSLGLGCTFLSCCSCTTNVACWCFLGISTWHCRKAGRQPDTNRAADLLLRHHFQAAICSLSFA